MTIDNTSIANLHHAYRTLTGFELGLDMNRERQWYEWAKRGNTLADLAMVIAYLKRQTKEGKRNPGALKFSNLIGNVDFFEEDLGMAKAEARKPKLDLGRESVLKATGRTSTKDTPPQTAEQVLRNSEALKAFKAFRESL